MCTAVDCWKIQSHLGLKLVLILREECPCELYVFYKQTKVGDEIKKTIKFYTKGEHIHDLKSSDVNKRCSHLMEHAAGLIRQGSKPSNVKTHIRETMPDISINLSTIEVKNAANKYNGRKRGLDMAWYGLIQATLQPRRYKKATNFSLSLQEII